MSIKQPKRYEFAVEGKAVAFKRPRWDSRNRRTFNDDKYTAYKNLLRGHAARIAAEKLTGAIHAEINVYVPIPTKFNKVDKEKARAGIIRPQTKPDIDNYVKTAFDACNNILFDDDNQIVSVLARKYYSDTPRIEMKYIEILEESDVS